MLHRIRESLKDKNSPLLGGTVEVDETYMGRKLGSEFKGLSDEQVQEMKAKNPRQFKSKMKGAVMGLAQREGKIKTKVFNEIDSKSAQQYIIDNVQPGSKVYSDQSGLYRSGLDNYERETVRHGKSHPEFARGDVHVNTLESFWNMFKRGHYGIYHYMSYKHLQRYCDEFAYRYNNRKMKDADRFNQSFNGIIGRLDYKTLIGKNTIPK